MKLLSIIIPVYNSSKTIERCLESIVNQTYKNIEIIVVDDGSTDNTKKIIKKFNVKYYYQKNSGVSTARNKGLKESSGDYMMFVDSDDTIDKHVVKLLMDKVQEKNIIGVLHTNIFHNTKKIGKYSKLTFSREEYIYNTLSGKLTGTLWGMLFKNTRNTFFDEKTGYMEDCIFIYDYIKNNGIKTIKYIDKNSYYNYYINEYSVTNSKDNLIDKCRQISYSYTVLNEITDYRYNSIIQSKKLSLIENKLQYVENKSDIKEMFETVKFQIQSGTSIRLIIFSLIYNLKSVLLIKMYYIIRYIAKQVLKNSGDEQIK